jgi:hypothetical protein
MALVGKFFWLFAALDAVLPVTFSIATIVVSLRGQQKASDLHPILFLLIIVPLLAVGTCAYFYRTTRSQAAHWFLLALVVSPAVIIPSSMALGYLDQRKEAMGGNISQDPALTRFLAAIYKQDAQQVQRIAHEVDVNAVAPGSWVRPSYTPLKFAVEKYVASEGKADAKGRLEMIRLLLSLGAKPNPALDFACRAARSDALLLLFDAGADPNYAEMRRTDNGDRAEPAFYGCFYSEGLENLELFGAKGANFLLRDRYGNSTVMAAASKYRWDQVLYLHDQAVPLIDENSKQWMSARIAEQIESAKKENREPPEAFKKVVALLPPMNSADGR